MTGFMKILSAIVTVLLLAGPVWAWEQKPAWEQPTYTPGGQPATGIPGSPYVYTPNGGMAIKTPGSPYAIPLDDNGREQHDGDGPRRGGHEQSK